MNEPQRVLFSAAALLAVAGCGGGQAEIPQAVFATGEYQSLRFTTATTSAVHERGGTIPITFTVQNVGEKSVPYSFGGCDEFAVVAAAREDQPGQFIGPFNGCAGNIKVGSFSPGETRTFTLNWDAAVVSPGEYRVTAELSVYSLGGERFLDQDGIHYPQRLGAGPIAITVR